MSVHRLSKRKKDLDSKEDCPFEIVFETEPSPDTQTSKEEKEGTDEGQA